MSDRDMMDWDEAVEVISDAMVQFDNFVSNEQGACDTGTFNSMMAAARGRYDQKIEAQG